VFVKNQTTSNDASHAARGSDAVAMGIGLQPGSRLRAHLTAAVNTAVDTPVVAVVDYNYIRNGEMVVPAGSKVFGRLESADRSGYLAVRFDSMLLPSGESVTLQATATDLKMRPLRGKAEGKYRVKRVLVTSATGVGEIAATVLGAGHLNQPLNQGYLVKSRVAENIGQASDNQVAQLAVIEHVVVSLPANTEIYVVLEKAANAINESGHRQTGSGQNSQSAEELRQLLQLQKELNQPVAQDGMN